MAGRHLPRLSDGRKSEGTLSSMRWRPTTLRLEAGESGLFWRIAKCDVGNVIEERATHNFNFRGEYG